MNELTLVLDNTGNTPLYEQIYQYIKSEIKSGKIECKTKLPSSRSLASHLQVSRSTVDMAYTQLISEGYIESVPCKGYYVCEISLLYDINIPKRTKKIPKTKTVEERLIDFSPNGIDLEYFPFGTWRKISRSILNEEKKELFDSGNYKGDEGLRRNICNYLFEARNVHCSPDNIIIGAGNDFLMTILCRLMKQTRVIAMESPTYQRAYQVFRSNDKKVVTVKVEKDGIDVESLRSKNADLVYVMPSHQYPLGTVMSIRKRNKLLKWANEKDERYIIEDDYDSEFRYHGKPIPALMGIDNTDKVIYIGTFSKSIAPAIRMSYMVLPEHLMNLYEKEISFYSQTVSRIDQAVVSEFIENGHFERHLNKMRSIYREKHDMVLSNMKDMGKMISIYGANAGLHIVIKFNNGMTEKELIDRAHNAGVKVYPLSEYYIDETYKERNAVIMGFAKLNHSEIKKGIELLKKAWNGG